MKQKRTWVTILVMIALGVMFYCWIVPSDTTNRRKLETQFQAEFGFPPPATFALLRGRTVTIGDTWSRWMQFTLDEASLLKLGAHGFTETNSEVLKTLRNEVWTRDLVEQSPNAPKWWRLPETHPVRIFYRQAHAVDFAGFTFLWIDDTNRIVYSESSAWR